MIKAWKERQNMGLFTTEQMMQAEIDELRGALQEHAALVAENERLRGSAKYAEHIDATPENQRQTMLHDALTERDALSVLLAERDVEIACLNDSLSFVERWAVHHANKPGISAENALGCIAHYPPIKAITKSYVDGAPSHLPDPYEAIAARRNVLRQALDVATWCVALYEEIGMTETNTYAAAKSNITAIQEVLHE